MLPLENAKPPPTPDDDTVGPSDGNGGTAVEPNPEAADGEEVIEDDRLKLG